MATIIVTTLNDENDGGATVASPGGAGLSLREALALANGDASADTIVFDPSLAGGTIRLGDDDGNPLTAPNAANGTLQVNTGALTIDGDINDDGTADILITGDVANDDQNVGATDITDIVASQNAGTLTDNVRIFEASADLTIDGFTLTGGVTNGGGGAVMGTNVTLANSTVSGNSANFGGGIAAIFTANLTNSTVSGNSAGLGGGGVSADTANLASSTVSGNSAGFGGGIDAGTATLTNSTVSANDATSGGGINAGAANLTNSTVSGNSAGIGAAASTLAPPISPIRSCSATMRQPTPRSRRRGSSSRAAMSSGMSSQ